MEQLFLGKLGTWLIMFTVMGLVVLLLRVLFGPRGFFRDPEWDRRNEEIRSEEAAVRLARLKAWEAEQAGKRDGGDLPEK